MKRFVYDAGVLIAADRNERAVWATHKVLLEGGAVPIVPAPIVAQASRSPAQVQMRRLLRGCEVVAFTEADAHLAGTLLGKSRTRDIADASVVSLAIQRRANIMSDDASDDASDIVRLLGAARSKLSVLPVR